MNSLVIKSLHPNSRLSLLLPPFHGVFPCAHSRIRRGYGRSMRVLCTLQPVLTDGVLRINGSDALTSVPKNVTVTPSVGGAAFLGTVSEEESSRLVFKLGVLMDCRLLCLYRFRIFWMLPRMGKSASDIPIETQLLFVEATAKSAIDDGIQSESINSPLYILFLPVIDGAFRSSLQGDSLNQLEFCIESGDPMLAASQFPEAVFVNYGDNPFDVLKQSMKILEKHKGTFTCRESKQMPGMLDWFGWCTWDAFYHDVNPKGIVDGLTSLSEGDTPARFLIIDDGWQDTENEFRKEGEPFVEGSQFGGRLVSLKENSKFRGNEMAKDLKEFVSNIKNTFGLKYVYMWHALMGYWGGLHPDAPGTKKYNPRLLYPTQSPGNLSHLRDLSMDCMEKYGVGAIDPAKIDEFYDDLHGYLVSQNVDGVKVDVQNILETIGSAFGGRVSLAQQFHKALEKSVSQNFQDNSIICCMAHNTDSIYHSQRSAVTRASDDYMPRNQSSQTVHVAAVSFNSLLLGEVMVPDWDMFWSRHYAAEFHAVARAVGGCGVYISDKPGHHDFTILKRLVLPDGSVLRAKYPGRPTRDCLFQDPIMDGKSLLKIWNLNKCTGVIGVFNCQGAGIWPGLDAIEKNGKSSEVLQLIGRVSPTDVEYFEEVAGKNWMGDCAVFSFNAGALHKLPMKGSLDVSLKLLECDTYTISPIKVYNGKIQFAPIGLIKMYNSGGAVEALDYVGSQSNCHIHIKGRGCGPFGAYSSIKPKACVMNSEELEFSFGEDNFLKVVIPHETNSWDINIHFEAL